MENIRKQINNIDDKIYQLFIERMELVKQISLYKKANNLLVEDKKREKEIIDRMTDEDNLLSDLYVRVLKEIISVSKIYQKTFL